MKIVLCAENFAFGPVGKLLTVVDKLEGDFEFTFVGYGTAFQLAKLGNIKNVYEINTDSHEFESLAREHFQGADLIISCMDRASIILAQKMDIPTIWLDTLFWWWDEIPEYLFNVNLYLKQNSLNDSRNLEKYKDKIKNLQSVGPIVDLTPMTITEKKNQVMICYGGMEADGWYKVGKDTNYPFIITELLINKVDFSKFEKVIFSGNERIINELRERFENSKFKFETYPHNTFVEKLVSSELVLMTPGLETPLEAFVYNIPTIFLPPSNSSQYAQLDDFRSLGGAEMSIHFKDYYEKLDLERKSLVEIMQMFLIQLQVFEKDDNVLNEVAEKINKMINDKKLIADQLKGQQNYIARLGNNGLSEAINKITKLIEGITK